MSQALESWVNPAKEANEYILSFRDNLLRDWLDNSLPCMLRYANNKINYFGGNGEDSILNWIENVMDSIYPNLKASEPHIEVL